MTICHFVKNYLLAPLRDANGFNYTACTRAPLKSQACPAPGTDLNNSKQRLVLSTFYLVDCC